MPLDSRAHGIEHCQPCTACGRGMRVMVPGGDATAGAFKVALELQSRALAEREPRTVRLFRKLSEEMPEEALEELVNLMDELVALRERHPAPMEAVASTDGKAVVVGDPDVEARVDELFETIGKKMRAGVAEGRRRPMDPTKKPPDDHGPS